MPRPAPITAQPPIIQSFGSTLTDDETPRSPRLICGVSLYHRRRCALLGLHVASRSHAPERYTGRLYRYRYGCAQAQKKPLPELSLCAAERITASRPGNGAELDLRL